MSSKKSAFNNEWLNPNLHPVWAATYRPVKGDVFSVFCKLCCKTFSLSNMGKQAITSHEKGAKHVKKIRGQKTTTPLLNLLTDPITSSAPSDNVETIIINDLSPTPKQKMYFNTESVIEAEILWALHTVETHFSINSVNKTLPLIKRTFKDSTIAEKMTLGSNKLSYYITFGLAPYFNEELENIILQCDHYVACFDESMNRIAQRGQMDIVIKFWNNSKNIVESRYTSISFKITSLFKANFSYPYRYLKSVFMTGATAEDILEHFKAGVAPLKLRNLLQVSMDGPNVNWKFLRLLNEEEDVNILDLGSCGLHILHGAFQTGNKAAGWSLNETLRGIYWLFKDSPARRAAYIKLTGQCIFPLKFCSTRWIESAAAANRALSIIDSIQLYVFDENTKLPNVTTVKNVKECCKDALLKCKLAFFATIASSLESFLTRFQAANPMAPFLYEELNTMSRFLLGRFIKAEVLQNSISSLLKLDFNKETIYLPYSKIDIGFSARKYLKTCQASEKHKVGFLKECRQFLISLVKKIFERSSLKYGLTKALSSLDPGLIIKDHREAQERMKNLLQALCDKGIIDDGLADNCMYQYKRLTTDTLSVEYLKSYTSVQRVDTFYTNLLSNAVDYKHLYIIVKIALIFSHGNASVESGFSVNKNMLIENIHEKSLIARRQVYDAIMNAGGTVNMEINKKMKLYCRNAHMKYICSLEDQRKANNEEEQNKEQRKRAMVEITLLKKKKAKLNDVVKYENQNIDKDLAKLRKKI